MDFRLNFAGPDSDLLYTYHIKNRHSGLYLTVADYSKDALAKLEQAILLPPDDGRRASQSWFLFPGFNGCIMVSNVRSQMLMCVEDDSAEAGALVQQNDHPVYDPFNSYSWLIGPGTDYFTFQNASSLLYLSVADHSHEPSAAVLQFPLHDGRPDSDSQHWEFELDRSIPCVPPEVPSFLEDDVNSISPFHAFTRVEMERRRTVPRLLGLVAIPSPLVNDKNDSFYYTLRRYGWWGLAHHRCGNAPAIPLETKVGLTSGNDEEVRDIVGISVCHDASLVLSGFMSLYGMMMVKKLKVVLSPTMDVPEHPNDRFKPPFVPGLALSDSVWYREDRYELYRVDGSKVLEWTTRNSTSRCYERVIDVAGSSILTDLL